MKPRPTELDATTSAGRRTSDTGDEWRTALTCIEPNKILVRGYPLDEIMGRLTFGEAIYLLLVGEIPSPSMGRLMEALLVSFIDHGATPPSTLAARNTATTGAPLRACVAAGVLGFGRYHGGDIETLHAVSRQWPRARARGRRPPPGGRAHRPAVCGHRTRCRRDSAIAFTRAIRARRDSSRWRSSSRSRPITSR